MFEETNNVKIQILIKESEYLIEKNEISEQQFKELKSRIHQVLTEVIQSDLKEEIKKNAFIALKPYQGKSKLDFFSFNWLYKIILTKVAWDQNMPFLVGKRKTDIFKAQILKIQMQLKAIDIKLNDSKI